MSPLDAKARFEALEDLFETTLLLQRVGLKQRFPLATDLEREERLRRWLQDADNVELPRGLVLRPSR
jgi:hypothetical protein